LSRTRIVSPVNGYVTNLFVQESDYATAGQHVLAVINSDSFWIDGYFEETVLGSVRVGDSARVSLSGLGTVLRGHVVGIARGISVPNAQSDPSGLAKVNPIFTWIRLAQRIPVRVALDDVPPKVTLAVGLTATVEIHSHLARQSKGTD
jgi:multidrug resistance efflux pump